MNLSHLHNCFFGRVVIRNFEVFDLKCSTNHSVDYSVIKMKSNFLAQIVQFDKLIVKKIIDATQFLHDRKNFNILEQFNDRYKSRQITKQNVVED